MECERRSNWRLEGRVDWHRRPDGLMRTVASMREVSLGNSFVASETATLRACIATILETPLEVVPEPVIEQGGVGYRAV
jgi:hypothetical protein